MLTKSKPFSTLNNSELDEWTQRLDKANTTSVLASTDFWALSPQNSYVFVPTRELWPGAVINARLPTIEGTPPARWLMQNRAVEQATWAPGEPMIIQGRLVSEGGWIDHEGARCLNFYRPPQIQPGDPAKAGPWLDHVKKVFPADANHIIKWLAHRVQRPAEKINHALVLGGAQGIGKDCILAPVKHAIGHWNWQEVSPEIMMQRFTGFLKSVVLRMNEAHDTGEADKFKLYERMKLYSCAPPETLRVNEKNIREYHISNACGIIVTTNYKTGGIYLPADDRRHYVAWSDLTKEQIPDAYWKKIWGWYEQGGIEHVAAYLVKVYLSDFDPKAPPPTTSAFWAIVDSNRSPEDAELADALDKLGNPPAVTVNMITTTASGNFAVWLSDNKNRARIPHRFEQCDYERVRSDAKDGYWIINGTRQSVYARKDLAIRERILAAQRLQR
jgi:hypothetical protein